MGQRKVTHHHHRVARGLLSEQRSGSGVSSGFSQFNFLQLNLEDEQASRLGLEYTGGWPTQLSCTRPELKVGRLPNKQKSGVQLGSQEDQLGLDWGLGVPRRPWQPTLQSRRR